MIFLAVIVLAGLSGLPRLIFHRSRFIPQLILLGLACAVGLGLAVMQLLGQSFPWSPSLDSNLLHLDPLTAFFLIPVYVMGFWGLFYAQGYYANQPSHKGEVSLGVFWGLAIAGMALLLAAQQALVFLVGWELMALSGFFLINSPDTTPEARKAGWFYLLATHLSTLGLIFLFLLWKHFSGSFLLVPLTSSASGAGLTLFFLIALLSFGLKAGLVPLHMWLPSAHAGAPTPVSALLSGVLIKMGIYGLIRMLFLIPHPPALWGTTLLAVGAVSGVFGVVKALAQHDIKRLLAYHSVENIGIIALGLGLALLGRTFHQPLWYTLGLAGALLHVLNHALFKSLLFLGAGTAVKAAGSRHLDALGGLLTKLPLTAGLFFLGAAAITGLPPLNGFVSEWLIVMGSLSALSGPGALSLATLLTVTALSMIGALALACFVKVTSSMFLGSPRKPEVVNAGENALMTTTLFVLGGLCALIGLFPWASAPLLDPVTALLAPGLARPLAEIVPLNTLSLFTGVLGILLLVATVSIKAFRSNPRVLTWDCGYAQPSSRMQYTASSLSRPLRLQWRWLLRQPPRRAFRLPRFFIALRRLPQGLTQQYVLYVFLAALLFLATQLPWASIVTLVKGSQP
ncbi:MAG: hypothetical protein HKM05_12540 [Spirochaetales bacterium]|nr:hypothetical protein [Spirochaetales bacterium]